MKPDTATCNSPKIEAFLADKLPVAEELLLEEHLSNCPNCREYMKNIAAEPATWVEASQFLTDEDFDCVLLRSNCEYSLVNRQSSDAAQSNKAQIDNVLKFLAPTDDPEMLGRLGEYEVSGVIGAGGMGIVLKGYDRSLDRTIAIKVLAPHLASNGAARNRFAREAKAAAAILHPNVIAIHSVSNDKNLPFLVMPYVRGSSLQRRLDSQGPMETREILRIGQQVAAGLAAAHAQGLVHRDIKPANILLEVGVERVTITDFGLARAVDDASMTRSGVIVGTPQYMSPEQASSEPIDTRSDLFSLGSLLYAMCTGHAPFRSETIVGVLRRITDEAPRAIREINSAVPTWLCQLITQLHHKQPECRIQTAAEVELILRQCIAHLEQPDRQLLPKILVDKHKKQSTWIRVCLVVGLLTFFSSGLVVVFYQMGIVGQTAVKTDKSHYTNLESATNQGPADKGRYSKDAAWADGLGDSLEQLSKSLEEIDAVTKRPFGSTVTMPDAHEKLLE